MRFDHVIYVAADLDTATARVASALDAVPSGGGEHEGMGTRNAIVPLGHGYVEVLALTDPTAEPTSSFASAVHARLASRGEGLFGWAMCVDDLERTAARLGTPIVDIIRDGFRARITGVAEAMGDPALPFFITRDVGVPDPGIAGAHDRIDRLEVAGDAQRLTDWLGELPTYLELVVGDGGVRALTVGGRELR